MSNVAPPASTSLRRLVWPTLISAVVVVVVLNLAGTDDIVRVFAAIGWRGSGFLLLVYVSTQTARTARLWIVMDPVSRPRFGRLFAIVSLHQLLNHILPARLGEAGFPVLMKRYSTITAAPAVSLLVLVRLQEVFVLALAVIVATPLFLAGREMSDAYPLLLIGGAIALLAVTAIRLLLPRLLRGFTAGLGHRITAAETRLQRWMRRGHAFLERLQQELAVELPPGRRFSAFLLTTLVWFLTFLLFHLVLQQSGFAVPFTATIIGSAFASVTHILPINALGSFGSLEAGWTLGFSLVGIDPAAALATGFVMHVLVLLFLVVLAIPAWFFLQRAGPGPARVDPV